MTKETLKGLLDYLIELYKEKFGQNEPYINLYLDPSDKKLEEKIRALEWCLENNKIILFYPKANEVLLPNYKPTTPLWDIF